MTGHLLKEKADRDKLKRNIRDMRHDDSKHQLLPDPGTGWKKEQKHLSA